jgi:hypothetical protein
MFRTAPPTSKARTIAAAAVLVGDWVQVDGDRFPGWNSEGGIVMVVEVNSNFSNIKCVMYSSLCLYSLSSIGINIIFILVALL